MKGTGRKWEGRKEAGRIGAGREGKGIKGKGREQMDEDGLERMRRKDSPLGVF